MDLVGITEISAMFEVSRARAHQLAASESFPKPVAELASGRIWRREDVEAWARETGRLK